jgi:hypothetical protein
MRKGPPPLTSHPQSRRYPAKEPDGRSGQNPDRGACGGKAHIWRRERRRGTGAGRIGQHWEHSPAHRTCRTYVVRGTSDSGSLGVGAPHGVLSPVSSDRSGLERVVHHSNLPACTTRLASGHHAVTRADEPNVAERAMPPSRRQFRNSTAPCVNAGGAAGNRTRLSTRQYGF